MKLGLTQRFGAISAAAILLLAGCRFPYGLAGGGLDPKLRTVAVLPFTNETSSAGLERELSELLSADMRKLGLREAREGRADVVVSGRISKYDIDIPVAYSADRNSGTGTRRMLEATVDVTIVDQRTGRTLFEKRGLRAAGEYAESAEASGRRDAFTKIVNDIIAGVQSQW